MTKVKICGLQHTDDAALINKAKPDYAGIVMFFPKSHRNTEPDRAKAIINALDAAIKSVAVVVSPTVEQIKIIEGCGFDIIQIHGELSEAVYAAASLPLFKAFNVKDIDNLGEFVSHDKISGFVFDAAEPGSGKTFDWSMLAGLDIGNKQLILAGGLTAENVAAAIKYLNPDVVDVSSGVENEDKSGKDADKVTAFMNAVI